MNGEARNTQVVVCLILAMTIGAGILLWLEPKPTIPGAGMVRVTPATPLMATGGIPVEEVTIRYALPRDGRAESADCAILPDGSCLWRADSPRVHLVVYGSQSDKLSAAQKKSLLAALGSMTLGRGGKLVQVRLDADSDVRREPGLPPQARDLCELLLRKGMID